MELFLAVQIYLTALSAYMYHNICLMRGYLGMVGLRFGVEQKYINGIMMLFFIFAPQVVILGMLLFDILTMLTWYKK